jgi:hypothetical protein
MNVREQAFYATLQWLQSETGIDAPQPPEGMHELALEEWWEGVQAAHVTHAANQEAWQKTEDFIVFLVKAATIYALLGVSWWTQNGYIMVAGGILGLVLMRKFWNQGAGK